MFWKKPSIRTLLPPPVKAAHGEYSMIFSLADQPAELTPRLLEVSLEAIQQAARVDLGEIGKRNEQAKKYANLWPGEHYRLLAGLVIALKPKQVIEIGTSTGLSALCLKRYLPRGSQVITFDVTPWSSYPTTLLRKEDFEDQRLVQHVADLSDASVMHTYAPLIESAGLIFIDATHDGTLEEKIMANLQTLTFQQETFVMLDDIRVWNMLKMWREISLPKIDLTSFGHWSGTGLVSLCNRFSLPR
jgi:predicted O-methyltransferase YrrM